MRNLPKILQQGLVGWWDSTGKDLSGNGNSGTLVNAPTKVRRLQNDGLSYNGTSQYMTVPSAVKQSGVMTFTCWLNIMPSFQAYSYITSDWGYYQRNYLFYIASGQIRVVTGNGSNLNDTEQVGFTLVANKPVMFTYVRNGTLHEIYKNGILFTSQTGSYSGGATGNATHLATSATAITDWYLGDIINPMVYNRALSAQEIQLLHKSLFIV